MNSCTYLPVCSGCHFKDLPYVQQTEFKLQTLSDCLTAQSIVTPPIKTLSLGQNQLRHRFDFTIDQGKIGLYGLDKSILDITKCLQISDELQEAYEDIRKVTFPIRKGSVRLRVGPGGKRGVWLDFANIDIKNLLEDGKAFQQLLNLGFQIEIGQKGRSLVKLNDQFKLADPISEDWFQTNLKDYVTFNLKSLISSFTQPSWITANAMVEIIHTWVDQIAMQGHLTICEFGSGIGQFTLPLLSYGHAVDVYEFDKTATELLKLNSEIAGLTERLKIYCDDFQKKSESHIPNYDIAFVNPPRSGLKNFVHELTRIKTPSCIYVSCFPESLAMDLNIMQESGYVIKEIVMVDQFPQTKHFETCVLLQRIDPNAR